jgi:hypothetical protein
MFIKEFVDEQKSLSQFQRGIRSSIRSLWNGTFNHFEFVDNMRAVIEQGFRRAWAEGAKQCGVSFDELTKRELDKLEQMTNAQFVFLPGLADDILENSKANGGKLQPLFSRGDMWISEYRVVRDQATGMACGDKKKKWVLGAAEHCKSCIKLNGKVKRASFWIKSGILPQRNGASYLECRGFNCACELVDTDEPISKGPLPRLP